ncbi:MCE family protein [Jatrophihabitans sp.]|jgi:virulence factor Mce-like protein|uniref:MCE family protein n=1 Tax=Jatrophihabitans sp. TaxID=1932789 RepID=UPI002F152BF9
MSQGTGARKLKTRLAGLVFLTVLAGLVSLSIAAYQQVFTKATMVTLDTDHTGAQLQLQSDVKLRGIVVGTVRDISTYNVPARDGRQPETRARLRMALNPSRAKLIPVGASALLLPKTLFGERYVALQVPNGLQGAKARPVRSGDTISAGRDAIEVERVLDDLYPVLLALHPQDLKAMLTALATALQGRGKQLGDNLAAFNRYLLAFNPKVPTLVDDLDKLGQVASLYDDAAPDLLASLNNLQTTNQTITRRPQALDQLLTAATSTSNEIDSFLNADGNYLIELAASSSKILRVLADFSPEYPCLAQGLAGLEPRLEDTFGGKQPGLHITLEFVNSRGKYVPGNEPRQVGGTAQCYGLPHPAQPFPGINFPDGAPPVGPTGPLPSADRAAYHASGVGSVAETKLISALLSGSYGDDPAKVPALATLLAGPLLRGSEVGLG